SCAVRALQECPFAYLPFRNGSIAASESLRCDRESKIRRRLRGKTMTKLVRTLPAAAVLMLPMTAHAQKAGQIVCGPRDAYSYLYSSITSMEVSAKVACGQTVRVLDRSDNFVRVQTAEGVVGYVALDSISFLKNGAASKGATPPLRYDKPEPPAKPTGGRGELVVANQTAVHLKLGRALSSETAKVGEEVNFEVAEDLVVNGHTVINKGAPAAG